MQADAASKPDKLFQILDIAEEITHALCKSKSFGTVILEEQADILETQFINYNYFGGML